jgi:hypothetical protein
MEKIESYPNIEEGIAATLEKDKTGDFGKAEEEIKEKTEKSGSTSDFRARFARTLSEHITNGLIQLIILHITSTDDYSVKFKMTDEAYEINLEKFPPLYLDEFYPYQDVVVKYGEIDVWKQRFEFKVQSKIDLANVKITVRQQKISTVDFGSLTASLTLFLMKGKDPMKLDSFKCDLELPTIACSDEKPHEAPAV